MRVGGLRGQAAERSGLVKAPEGAGGGRAVGQEYGEGRKGRKGPGAPDRRAQASPSQQRKVMRPQYPPREKPSTDPGDQQSPAWRPSKGWRPKSKQVPWKEARGPHQETDMFQPVAIPSGHTHLRGVSNHWVILRHQWPSRRVGGAWGQPVTLNAGERTQTRQRARSQVRGKGPQQPEGSLRLGPHREWISSINEGGHLLCLGDWDGGKGRGRGKRR